MGSRTRTRTRDEPVFQTRSCPEPLSLEVGQVIFRVNDEAVYIRHFGRPFGTWKPNHTGTFPSAECRMRSAELWEVKFPLTPKRGQTIVRTHCLQVSLALFQRCSLALRLFQVPRCSRAAINRSVSLVSRRHRTARASFADSLLAHCSRSRSVQRRRLSSSAMIRSALPP
jgi:hypothetical protein